MLPSAPVIKPAGTSRLWPLVLTPSPTDLSKRGMEYLRLLTQPPCTTQVLWGIWSIMWARVSPGDAIHFVGNGRCNIFSVITPVIPGMSYGLKRHVQCNRTTRDVIGTFSIVHESLLLLQRATGYRCCGLGCDQEKQWSIYWNKSKGRAYRASSKISLDPNA